MDAKPRKEISLGARCRTKAKGRFLSREIALPVRFFEALVRLPNHNIVIPKSFLTRELGPRFSSLFQDHSS